VLENVDNSFAELAGEVVEDQVRVCLRDCFNLFFYIVSQHDVLESKVDGWS